MNNQLATMTLRNEHRLLSQGVEALKDTARVIPHRSAAERQQLIDARAAFLHDHLIPHIAAEENILYPQWEKMVGADGTAQLLRFDHQQIIDRIGELEDATVSDSDYLQELLYGLYALISVHTTKEEELQFPAFDAEPETAAWVIAEMDLAEQLA